MTDTNKKKGFDIDGTVLTLPRKIPQWIDTLGYTYIGNLWARFRRSSCKRKLNLPIKDGEFVTFITARPEADREHTTNSLIANGFLDFKLIMFDKPIFQHDVFYAVNVAKWKYRQCMKQGIGIYYEDNLKICDHMDQAHWCEMGVDEFKTIHVLDTSVSHQEIEMARTLNKANSYAAN